MSERSPSGASAPPTASTPLLTGRLSPVSAASAISSVAADGTRPSAGTTSPASISTTSPGTSCSAGNCASLPSRRPRALAILLFARARPRRGLLALLVEAEDGVEQRQQQDHDARAGLLDRIGVDDARHQQDDLHR